MRYLKYIISFFKAILFFILFITGFRIVEVVGDSMFPTFHNGDLLISYMVPPFLKTRKWMMKKTGKIFVFSPNSEEKDYYAIKRLAISSSQGLFFVGDNSENSYDSRDYGYIPPKRVKCIVIKRIKKGDF